MEDELPTLVPCVAGAEQGDPGPPGDPAPLPDDRELVGNEAITPQAAQFLPAHALQLAAHTHLEVDEIIAFGQDRLRPLVEPAPRPARRTRKYLRDASQRESATTANGTHGAQSRPRRCVRPDSARLGDPTGRDHPACDKYRREGKRG